MKTNPMTIEVEEIKYKQGVPFSAQICTITKQIPHYHETELELVYCLEGSVNLIAADQRFTLTSGMIHSIDFGDIHYLESDVDNITLIFHIDLSIHKDWGILEHVFFACESVHCYPYQEPAMRQVKDIVLSLSYAYLSGLELSTRDYEPAYYELSDTLFKYFNWFNYNNQDEYMNTALFERFTRILIYINQNYKEKISISQLANKEHINKNYFSQFISKTVFSSFSNMVNYTRCYNAEVLLLTTDKSVADISFECGFSDPKYFYSAFKTLWHTTPTKHREMYYKHYESAVLKSKNNSNTTITDNDATKILSEYIVKWHLSKTFD